MSHHHYERKKTMKHQSENEKDYGRGEKQAEDVENKREDKQEYESGRSPGMISFDFLEGSLGTGGT